MKKLFHRPFLIIFYTMHESVSNYLIWIHIKNTVNFALLPDKIVFSYVSRSVSFCDGYRSCINCCLWICSIKSFNRMCTDIERLKMSIGLWSYTVKQELWSYISCSTMFSDTILKDYYCAPLLLNCKRICPIKLAIAVLVLLAIFLCSSFLVFPYADVMD